MTTALMEPSKAEQRLHEELDEAALRSFERYMAHPKTLADVRQSYTIGDLTDTEYEVAVERILARDESEEEA